MLMLGSTMCTEEQVRCAPLLELLLDSTKGGDVTEGVEVREDADDARETVHLPGRSVVIG